MYYSRFSIRRAIVTTKYTRRQKITFSHTRPCIEDGYNLYCCSLLHLQLVEHEHIHPIADETISVLSCSTKLTVCVKRLAYTVF